MSDYGEYRAIPLHTKVLALITLWGSLSLSYLVVGKAYLARILAGVGVVCSFLILRVKTLSDISAEGDDGGRGAGGGALRRTLVVVAAALVLGVWLSACGGDSVRSSAQDGIATPLRMIGNENAAFLEVSEGVASGFSVDLATEIAARMNRGLTVDVRPFPSLFSLLQTGDADMAMSAITITPERRREVDFSAPYFESGQALLVRMDSAIAGAADLAGKSIGVLRGSTNQRQAQKVPDVGEIVAFDDKPPMFEALVAGAVDAVICDTPFALYNAKQSGETRVAAILTSGDQYGIAVHKGADQLRSAIDGALRTIRADGSYQRLYDKYFGT